MTSAHVWPPKETALDNALYYKEKDSCLYIKAKGHINANLSGGVRMLVFERFDSGEPVGDILVDLSECTYMDSTFMGLIVGFNKRLIKSRGRKLRIINPSADCMGLLTTLGIQGLAEIEQGDFPFPDGLKDVSGSQAASTEDVITAHEDLMEISEENKKKFELLHKILSEQMGKEGN